jgi:hypothetical protein
MELYVPDARSMVSPPFAAFNAASNPAVVDTLKVVPAPVAVAVDVDTAGVVPAAESMLETAASNSAVEDMVEVAAATVVVGTVEVAPVVVAIGTAEVAPAVEVRLKVVKVTLRYSRFQLRERRHMPNFSEY